MNFSSQSTGATSRIGVVAYIVAVGVHGFARIQREGVEYLLRAWKPEIGRFFIG